MINPKQLVIRRACKCVERQRSRQSRLGGTNLLRTVHQTSRTRSSRSQTIPGTLSINRQCPPTTIPQEIPATTPRCQRHLAPSPSNSAWRSRSKSTATGTTSTTVTSTAPTAPFFLFSVLATSFAYHVTNGSSSAG